MQFNPDALTRSPTGRHPLRSKGPGAVRGLEVEVRFRGVTPSGPLRDRAVEQAWFHLARFRESVTAVFIRVSDENGPKGGIDKRCHVVVRGPAIGSVSLSVAHVDAYAAVDTACSKVARMVGKELGRLSEGRVGELGGASRGG